MEITYKVEKLLNKFLIIASQDITECVHVHGLFLSQFVNLNKVTSTYCFEGATNP